MRIALEGAMSSSPLMGHVEALLPTGLGAKVTKHHWELHSLSGQACIFPIFRWYG